jgi:hypothetical protein
METLSIFDHLGLKSELTDAAVTQMSLTSYAFSPASQLWLMLNGYEIFKLPGNPLSYWDTKIFDRVRIDIAPEIPEIIRYESYIPTEAALKDPFVTNSIGKNHNAQQLFADKQRKMLPDGVQLVAGLVTQLVDIAMLQSRDGRVFGETNGFRSSSIIDQQPLTHCSVSFQGLDRRLFVKKSLASNPNPVLGQCALILPANIQ